ncbi:MAG: serine kinase [Limimaricola sp.]|uniref:HPr kinase/phosphorylase n=1 Tax=Limimaricola sp. TaxID=2211665 RepID=UPI001DA4FA9F|nr:HPr kinase/phosphatase C-terminal domain-containing protein [Limimaricola sp.]MBI1418634.1 serine kinase [Limimaricola sp.]
MPPEDIPHIMHATTVALGEAGLLILGRAGAGKSGLALQLMAFGCALVADDRTAISRKGDALIAHCPPAITGLIEARGIGLLRADTQASCRLRLAVDLDQTETERLPPERYLRLLDCDLPLVHNSASGHFAAALLQYLKAMSLPPNPETMS